jgi:hypothetical protein
MLHVPPVHPSDFIKLIILVTHTKHEAPNYVTFICNPHMAGGGGIMLDQSNNTHVRSANCVGSIYEKETT